MTRDLLRRVSALEHRQPVAPYRVNPHYLAAITVEDLEFVAALPIDGEPDSPPDGAVALMSEAERSRLDDIFMRMRHGPGGVAEVSSATGARGAEQSQGNPARRSAAPHRSAHHG